jgi:glycosyltransferase involved in cell wall biosynthesis
VTNPFFSVVIPVFNRAQALGVALRSVVSQSEQDFEIIVVDDGSRDNPRSVIDAFDDPRIVLVRQENKGGGAARNTGIDRARGRFVAFLDSDDRFLPNHLSVMRGLLEGSENTIGYAPLLVDRGSGRSFVKPPRALAEGEHVAAYLLCERGFVPTSTLVVPRDWAARLRYDESIPFAQDTDFAIRLFLVGCRFVMASEPTAIWHDGSDTKRISAGRKGALLRGWLENLRPQIPLRAYWGGQGWMIAKGVAESSTLAALRLYLGALAHGCYRPKLAIVVFLQIFVSDRLYRRLADWKIALFRGRVWSQGARIVRPVPN